MFFSIFSILATIVGIFIIWKQSKEKLYSEEELFDTIILSLIGAFLFSRIGYIIINYSIFRGALLGMLAFWVVPGFYIFGAIFGVLFVLWYKARQSKELTFLRLFDIVAFSFWVGLPIVYFGIFLDGKEQGIESFIPGLSHPLSLYKMVFFMIVLIPYVFFRRDFDREDWLHKTPGSVGLFVLILFSLATFSFDFLKNRWVWYGLSVDQWVSGTILILSVMAFYFLWKRTPKRDVNLFIRLARRLKIVR